MSDGRVAAGKIVETEAYLSYGDAASHSASGLNKRNKSMFDDGGTLYVYKIYGIHYCVNAVTETKGIGSAVLLRAAEPIAGIEYMRENRGESCKEKELCRGPGNLSCAFGISDKFDGISLCSPYLFFVKIPSEIPKISTSSRIGISKSSDLPLRYLIENSDYVSGKYIIKSANMHVK